MSILPSILLAVLVYHYDFVPSAYSPPGTPDSNYIEFLTPSGAGGLESIYALSITSFPCSNMDSSGNPLPVIPTTTFTLSQVDSLRGTLQWGFDSLYGELLNAHSWSIGFDPNGGGFAVYAHNYGIDTFFPWAYFFNEIPIVGNWKFAGTRNVPEAGSTLAYLAMSILAVAFCVAISRQSRSV